MLICSMALSGCLYGDLNKNSIEHFTNDAKMYCNSAGGRECENYSKCYRGVYTSYPIKFLRNNLLMYFVLKKEGNVRDYSNLMEDIYDKIGKLEAESRTDLSIQYSYMLYAHDQCALIMEGRKYDISKYEPYIKEEIRKKFESNQ